MFDGVVLMVFTKLRSIKEGFCSSLNNYNGALILL